ncbi:MAG: hypothetical protein KF805_02380 [Phycisphaeraceae bacterium]|nr:hypothetical protein [Phycisphaeraceae bacterium]
MNSEMMNEMTVVKVLPPEDIRAGMFVAVLYETHEVLPPKAFDVEPGQSVRPVRVACMDCADGEPRRVLTVCLPFVQVESPEGWLTSLDVRRQSVVALSEMFGLEAFTRPKRKDD